MITIAITDDEALFRKGLALIFKEIEDMSVILEAFDGQDLLTKLEAAETLPDILLLDLNMPNLNGIETAKLVKAQFPSVQFIILSTYFSKAFVLNLIEIGAAAYLPKNSLPEEVESTIREVKDKGFSFNQEVLKIIRDNMVQKSRPKLKTPFGIDLTNREKEILQLVCEEKTTAEIAENLFISPRTVEGHRNNLLQKLGCKNVVGLVVYAIREDLVDVSMIQTNFK